MTIFPSDFKSKEDLIRKANKIGYPLVVKPFRSRIRLKNGWVKTAVRYVKDADDLLLRLSNEPLKVFLS